MQNRPIHKTSQYTNYIFNDNYIEALQKPLYSLQGQVAVDLQMTALELRKHIHRMLRMVGQEKLDELQKTTCTGQALCFPHQSTGLISDDTSAALARYCDSSVFEPSYYFSIVQKWKCLKAIHRSCSWIHLSYLFQTEQSC